MFRLTLLLPHYLTDTNINQLCEVLAIESLAQTSMMIDGTDENQNKVWRIEWLLDHSVETDTFHTRAEDALKIFNIDIDIRPHDITCVPVEDRDWLSHSYQGIEPFTVGPYFVCNTDYTGDIPPTQMSLRIDAATAFGSGEHGTTKGCLEAIIELKSIGVCPWNALDMGTGSGILAIAGWKIWKTPILAVDIEAESVRVATHHCQINKVPMGAGNITLMRSDGFTDPIVIDKGPYECIIANILISPLKAMANDMVAALDTNGYTILSGILDEQKDDILDVYVGTHGLALKKSYSHDGWTTLVLHKR